MMLLTNLDSLTLSYKVTAVVSRSILGQWHLKVYNDYSDWLYSVLNSNVMEQPWWFYAEQVVNYFL